MAISLTSHYFDDTKSTLALKNVFLQVPSQSSCDVPIYSPPDLLQDDDEDDEESLSTPFSFSPKQQANSYFGNLRAEAAEQHHRRKSVPHKSPSLIDDAPKASLLDKSVVFQLDVHSQVIFPHSTDDACSDGDESSHACDLTCTSKAICEQSLLSVLRKRIVDARHFQEVLTPTRQVIPPRKRTRAASFIEIPKPPRYYRRRRINNSVSESLSVQDDLKNWTVPKLAASVVEGVKIPVYGPSNTTSGRPSRIKGPCQACQEASDGCMRKAFHWPFPTNQVFNDKGKPFVYLCNKCGLRYNKSGGCVCRHCRWVFCKEEKRKALHHIELMRQRRNGGYIDPDEDIEDFVCSPKYWTCNRPWKVGWVLNHLDEEEEEDCNHTVSSHNSN